MNEFEILCRQLDSYHRIGWERSVWLVLVKKPHGFYRPGVFIAQGMTFELLVITSKQKVR